MIRVVIADDHQIFIDGLVSLLEEEAGIEVVGTATDGHMALDILSQAEVDILVVDIEMPNMNGLDVLREIEKNAIATKVLVLSTHGDRTRITDMLSEGAKGYILKNRGARELVAAIHKVTAGDTYYSSEVMKTITDGLNTTVQKSKLSGAKITDREKEVLRYLADELNTHEIANKMFIAPATVESHKKKLKKKLGVKGVQGLVRYAVENGILN